MKKCSKIRTIVFVMAGLHSFLPSVSDVCWPACAHGAYLCHSSDALRRSQNGQRDSTLDVCASCWTGCASPESLDPKLVTLVLRDPELRWDETLNNVKVKSRFRLGQIGRKVG